MDITMSEWEYSQNKLEYFYLYHHLTIIELVIIMLLECQEIVWYLN